MREILRKKSYALISRAIGKFISFYAIVLKDTTCLFNE